MGPNQHTPTTLVITPGNSPLGFVQAGTCQHFPTTRTLWWSHELVGGPTSFSPPGPYFLAVRQWWSDSGRGRCRPHQAWAAQTYEGSRERNANTEKFYCLLLVEWGESMLNQARPHQPPHCYLHTIA